MLCPMSILIRHGKIEDAPLLQEIERAAGKLFLTVGMDDVAGDDPTSVSHFSARARQGRLLVAALAETDQQVGFLYWSNRDGYAYTEEVAVHPEHAGNRLGARLFDALQEDAGRDIKALTLATFRDVPWNAPYYARLGFVECDCTSLGPGHLKEWQRQSDDGLDMRRRIFMRRAMP